MFRSTRKIDVVIPIGDSKNTLAKEFNKSYLKSLGNFRYFSSLNPTFSKGKNKFI